MASSSLVNIVLAILALLVFVSPSAKCSNQHLKKTNSSSLSRSICAYDYTCQNLFGTASRCYNGNCICNLGYQVINSQCTKTSCTFDFECTTTYPNTVCSSGSCVCNSAAAFSYLDPNSQTCKTNCDANSDCIISMGFNADCINSKCVCDMGYQVVDGQCSQYSCSEDIDCLVYWSNSWCFAGTCSCDAGSNLDYDTQTCKRFDDDGDDFTVIPLILLLAFLIISSCIGMIIQIRLRTYRQQIQNTTSQGSQPPLSTLSSTVQQQSRAPPPGFKTNAALQNRPPPYSPATYNLNGESTTSSYYEPPPPYSNVNVSN